MVEVDLSGQVREYAVRPNGALQQVGIITGPLFAGALAVDAADKYGYVAEPRGRGVWGVRLGSHPRPGPSLGSMGTATRPDALAVDLARRLLFVSSAADRSVFAYQIEPRTGQLRLLQGVRESFGPSAMLSVGNALYVAATRPRVISEFLLTSAGRLEPIGSIATGGRDVALLAAGSFVLAANYGYASAGDLWVYRRLPTSGRLRLIGRAGVGAEPDALAADPSGRFVYVANWGSGYVSELALDPASGQVATVGIAPTDGPPTTMTVDPAGRYLYVGCVGGLISEFRIDPRSGALESIGATSGASNPVAMAALRS